MELKKKAMIAGFIVVIGFIAAIIGLRDNFFLATADNEITILPLDTPDINVSNTTMDSHFLKANKLVIDGIQLNVEDGGLLMANKIIMKNGGEITGSNIYVVATIIDSGKIKASYSNGMDAGDIFVVSAQLNGTAITANGKEGKTGANGTDGSHGSIGKNGSDGICKAFGGKHPPVTGGTGGNGANGADGANGLDGGNAGKLTLLTSYKLTILPESNGGAAGKGGKGGAPGLGGKGGKGGRGCTGLGGVQSSQPSGPNGNNGIAGKDGQDGRFGHKETPIVKYVNFIDVKQAVEKYADNKAQFISELMYIRPKK